MFQLTKKEWLEVVTDCDNLVRQKYLPSFPMVFTEKGVSMLSGILKSKNAVKVNIAIMRAFVQMRHLLEGNKELANKIQQLEKKYDKQFKSIFDEIKNLIQQEPSIRTGFIKGR